MTEKGASRNSVGGGACWELKIVRTWRVCAYRLESKSPYSQFGRTDLASGPESGTLLPKRLLVDGQSDVGHRALQGSRKQEGSENVSKFQGVYVGGRWGQEEGTLSSGKTESMCCQSEKEIADEITGV